MKRVAKVLALAVALALALTCAAFAEERPAEYLSAYYNVSFEGEVTVEAFNDALSALGEPAVEAETLTLADAVVAAVKLADMDELAMRQSSAAWTRPAERAGRGGRDGGRGVSALCRLRAGAGSGG